MTRLFGASLGKLLWRDRSQLVLKSWRDTSQNEGLLSASGTAFYASVIGIVRFLDHELNCDANRRLNKMEALPAFGLAVNAMQLIQIISSIVCTARDVYSSASGSSRDVETIIQHYSRPQELHAELGAADHGGEGTEASYPDKSLMEYAAICNEKCSQLVKYASKLAVTREGKFKWISVIRVVFLTFWFQPDVKNLEKEISEIQTGMVLCTSPITRGQLGEIKAQTKAQTEDLSADIRCQIDMLCERLNQVDSAIQQGVESQNTGLATVLEELDNRIQEADAVRSRCQTMADEQAVLKSLDFDYRPTRYDTIHKAHESNSRMDIHEPFGSYHETTSLFGMVGEGARSFLD